MKKISFFTFFTICIIGLSMSAFAQKSEETLKKEAKGFKNSKRYIVKYDKFTDKTTVIYSGSLLNSTLSYMSSGTMMNINVAYEFKSQTSKNPIDKFVLFFRSSGKNWSFLKDRSLYVLADENRIEMGNGSHDSDIGRSLFGDVRTNEILAFEITKNQLSEFGNAKTLEIKLGGREFKIKDEDKTAFLNTIKLSEN